MTHLQQYTHHGPMELLDMSRKQTYAGTAPSQVLRRDLHDHRTLSVIAIECHGLYSILCRANVARGLDVRVLGSPRNSFVYARFGE